jgi:hypothetical protein
MQIRFAEMLFQLSYWAQRFILTRLLRFWKVKDLCKNLSFSLQESTENMSTLAEMPCYTLINVPSDLEPWSEQKLKDDLGKFGIFVSASDSSVCISLFVL